MRPAILLLALAACRTAPPPTPDRPGIASRKVSAAIICAALSSLIASGFSCSTNGPDHAVVTDSEGRPLYATTLPGTLRVVLLTRDGSTLIAGGDAGILWRLPLPYR